MVHIKRISLISVILITLVILFCSKEENNTTLSNQAVEDAVDVIAASIGENNGGALEQIGQIFTYLIEDEKKTRQIEMMDTTRQIQYDSTNSQWIIRIDRTANSSNDDCYAHIERTQTVQYLNQNNQAQKFRINCVESVCDTAAKIRYKILNGQGTLRNRRISTQLTNIIADWTITGCVTDTITINGSYSRQGIDTIRNAQSHKIVDYMLYMTLVDIKSPHERQTQVSDKISGVISGIAQIHVSFQRGETYRDSSFTQEFTIDLSNGQGNLTVIGRRFPLLLRSGERNE